MRRNSLMEQVRKGITIQDKALIDESFALSDRIFFLLQKHKMFQKDLALKLKERESKISN